MNKNNNKNNPSLFTVEDVTLYPYVYELQEDSARATRGFLTTKGRIAGDPVAVIVCHWPSRFSGSYYRELAAKQVRAVKDKILSEEPERRIFIMGDMNDDPLSVNHRKCISYCQDTRHGIP